MLFEELHVSLIVVYTVDQAKIILAIYDATDLSIEQIRELARKQS